MSIVYLNWNHMMRVKEEKGQGYSQYFLAAAPENPETRKKWL